MRVLAVVLLSVLPLSLSPAWCQELPPPEPQAVAQQFLTTLLKMFVAGKEPTVESVQDLVVPPAGEEAQEPGPETEMLYVMCAFYAAWWATQGASQTQANADRAEVQFIAGEPLRVIMTKVGDQWKVDLAATYAALPEPLRKALGEQETRAQGQACLSNLSQLALAALIYTQDHDGRLPDAEQWVDDLFPYVANAAIFKCPGAPDLEYGYAMNEALSGRQLQSLAAPAEAVLFFDSDLGKRNAAAGLEALAKPGRHLGGYNCCFADGHAKWMHAGVFAAPPEVGPPLAQPGAAGPPPRE